MLYDVEVFGERGTITAGLFFLYFLRYALLSSLQTMIPAVMAERIFASRYISDYENRNRAWISYMVNGGALTLAALYYILVQLICVGIFTTILLAAVTLSITIFSSVAMVVVYKRDAAKLHELGSMTGRSTINYALSMKFQLAENVRVTKVKLRNRAVLGR
ncbi:unnamed protein product [Cylicostephanus goldi]|uniref:Uncharacterized protein n=1 Tax=Cylicostephanus goldi TaxID=71465 RepID=A0A3P6SU50_CYLGO|nr:unnamed protein product [Cylicostephanus goldi]